MVLFRLVYLPFRRRRPGSRCPAIGMTATPQARCQELPDGHQDDRASQHHDDGSDEAERKSPADKGLGDEANDRRNDQVNEKGGAEASHIVTRLNGGSIG